MTIRSALWVLVFVFLFETPGIGQTRLRPEIINYPNAVYQAQSQNWSITQDEHGFIFVGNNEGLLSYNGAQWQLYPMPKHQILRCVAADHKGRIYGGGFGAFGYWQKEPLSGYVYHSLDRLIRDSMFSEEEIWKIIPTENQVLFQSFSRIHL
ncbi:MAG TPA: hypothetical protein VL053_13970, partial [Arachidicoccus sp.]|nr:hypothetical protein [Arachidicoccus sp.]